MPGTNASELFDSALRAIDLRLLLGGRETSPAEIATRLRSTLQLLESLDSRRMEWLHVNFAGQRSPGQPNPLSRDLEHLTLSVENGARVDDAGKFHPSFGYYFSALGFLDGSERNVCPFDISVTDGCQGPRSADSFKLRFADAKVRDRDAITDCVANLIQIWEPTRGGLHGLELARRHRNDVVRYPPIGLITFFDRSSTYTLPESPLIELRRGQNGTLAVLHEWTLDAVLSYESEFRSVNQGIPNRRLGN